MLLGLLLFTHGASAGVLTPESGGSPNADRIGTLYKIVLIMGAIVFAGVEGVLLYSLIKFRSSKGNPAAQIRGNTRLEIGWTVGATLIVIAIAVITLVKIGPIRNPEPSNPGSLITAGGSPADAAAASSPSDQPVADQPKPPKGNKLYIEVSGQQYLWRYTYPNKAYSYEKMVVPINTTVILDIKASDVAHSWWVPELGGKFDAIPGYTNQTWFKISEPGTFSGQCAELCGRNHANMLTTVTALPVDQYKRWVSRQLTEINEANRLAQKERGQFQDQ